MTFVGARHFVGTVVVVPRTQAQKSSSWDRLITDFGVQEVARNLSLYKLIVRQIVVERADHPIAVRPSIRIGPIAARKGIQTSIIIFAIARHIKPDTAPTFSIVRRSQQTIHHLCKCIGRIIFRESRLLFRRRRQPGEIQISTPQKIVFGGRMNRLEPFLFQAREHKAVNTRLRPRFILRYRFRRFLQRQERPEVPALRRDNIFPIFAGSHGGGRTRRPRSACLDPCFQRSHFRRLQLATVGHLQVRISLTNRFYEQTLVRISRH